MKKAPFLIFAVCFIVFFFTKCNNDKNHSNGSSGIDFSKFGFANFISESDFKTYQDNFESTFNRHHNDTLTRAVWFDRDFFHYIDSVLQKNQGSLDGVRIYFGAYDKIETAPGQGNRNNAISLFFTATRSGVVPGKHTDDFKAFELPSPLLLNHGELCPNNCD